MLCRGFFVSLFTFRTVKSKTVIITFLIFSSLVFHAQDAPFRADRRTFAFKAHVGIPKTLTSNMFRTAFNGVFDANVSFNLNLFEHVYMGIGYRHFQFENNKMFKQILFKASIPYNTKLVGHSPFVTLNYHHNLKSNFFLNYGLDYGFVLASYSKINEDTTSFNKPFGLKNFNSHLVQPSISANWMVDQYLAFTVLFSYTTMFSQFDPRAPRFNHFEKINEKSNNYFMSWFTFGFGVNVLFGKLKQK